MIAQNTPYKNDNGDGEIHTIFAYISVLKKPTYSSAVVCREAPIHHSTTSLTSANVSRYRRHQQNT